MSDDRHDFHLSLDKQSEEDIVLLPRTVLWAEACVKVLLGDDRYLLDNGRLTQRAASCLLQPQVGDRVMVLSLNEEAHIVHILARNKDGEALLSVSKASSLTLRQEEILIESRRRLRLRSLGDTEVTAATGTLSLQGRNLFINAVDSLVQQASHWICRMGHALIEASELLRMHSRQALVTADRDIKIDAERISMG